MTEKDPENKQISDGIDVLKRTNPVPPDALMARVLADAMAVQQGFSRPATSTAQRRPLREFFRLLGGWPAMAGLATAAVAGVWLGAYPPSLLPDATNSYLGLGDGLFLIDTAPGFGFDSLEEAL